MTIRRNFRPALLIAVISLCVVLADGCVTGSTPREIADSPDKTNNPNWCVPAGFTVETGEGWDRETGCAMQIVHIKSGIALRFVPAGEFDMGSRISPEEAERRYGPESQGAEWHKQEHPLHRVKISKPFYIGVYEVTQKQWKAIMGNNPANWKGDNLPIEMVSWEDAQEFCLKAGDGLRLPTEAEWEYACRAGTSTRWYFGDDDSTFGEYGWTGYNSEKRTHEVGLKKPNAWGLYDMHGNVWEWCQDWHDSKYYAECKDGATDPPGPRNPVQNSRVVRGGAWYSYTKFCRSANRCPSDPAGVDKADGFRVVMSEGVVR